MHSVVSFSTASGFKDGSTRPIPPKLHAGNKVVNGILRELEKVQRTRPHKRPKRIESLIYNITQYLRKGNENDHLLQTTSIWVLIHTYRLDPELSKGIMIRTGIPGVLHEIMKSEVLHGATKQYASELCYFLVSSQPYPVVNRNTGPINNHMADIPPISNKVFRDDSISDVSSLFDDTDRTLVPFEPYRIDKENLDLLDSLFSRKKRSDYDISLNNVTKFALDIGRGNMYTSGQDGVDEIDDGASVSSSISSESMGSIYNNQVNSGDSYAPSVLAALTQRSLFTEMNATRKFFQKNIPTKPKTADSREKHSQSYNGSLFDIGNMKMENASLYSQTTPLRVQSANSPLKYPTIELKRKKNNKDLSLQLNLSSSSQSRSLQEQTRSTELIKSDANKIDILPDFLAKLDPLSLNVTLGYHSAFVGDDDDLVSIDGSDSDDYETDEEEEDLNEVKANTLKNSITNGSIISDFKFTTNDSKDVKMRIRAEKLLDISFTKKLFNKKTTIKDAQVLLYRMETLFEVVDRDKTGYISWESFTSIILSVAPPTLLRADVIAFIEAQCDDMKALIDYREFIITGKVYIVEKVNKRTALPINGWIERQKIYSGDASTYSWVNHVKWYRKRLSTAIVWLMRRASRALGLYHTIEVTKRSLLLIGKRAKAINYCLEIARLALDADKKRIEAKRRLMKRCFHSRRWNLRLDEARRFLLFSAIGIFVEQKKHPDDYIVTELPPKPIQADYATLFKLYHQYKNTAKYLFQVGQRAVAIMRKKDEAYLWLSAGAKKVLTQLMILDQTREWLLKCGVKAWEHCIAQDDGLTYLIRIGTKAYRYMCRQESSLEWLLLRKVVALEYCKKQDDTLNSLILRGQKWLTILNKRENCFIYLKKRKVNAEKLIRDQAAAIEYLQSLPAKYWFNEDKVAVAYAWLVERAANGILHSLNQMKARSKLLFVATRATIVKRRVTKALIDLQQYGQYAKFQHFRIAWLPIPANKEKHRIAMAKLYLDDKEILKKRATLPLTERWYVELEDAFKWCTKACPLPGQNVENMIGRLSFDRLLKNGKLLNFIPEELDHSWSAIDIDASSCILFQDLWYWFKEEATMYHKELKSKDKGNKNAKGLFFLLNEFWSINDRALVECMLQFDLLNKHRGDDDDDIDGFSRNKMFDESPEESEEEEESDTEENDIKVFLKIQRKYFEDQEKLAQEEAVNVVQVTNDSNKIISTKLNSGFK